MTEFNFNDYKTHALTRPRDEAWARPWAKFEAVGDKVAGYIVDVFYRPAEGMYKEQRGLTLKQENGELINVSLKRLPYLLDKTDNLHLGDPVVIELTELKPSGTKGFNPTKIQSFYGTMLPENAGNKTVKQLDDEDRKMGGSSNPESNDASPASAEDEPFESAVKAFDSVNKTE